MRAPFKPREPRDIQKLAKLAKNGSVRASSSGFVATPKSITFLRYRSVGDGHDNYVAGGEEPGGQTPYCMPWRRFLALQGRAPVGWTGPEPLLLEGAYLLTLRWFSAAGFYDDAVSRLAAVGGE